MAASEVTGLARAAVCALGLTGASSVRVRRDAEGRPTVLGVEPRAGLRSDLAPELLDGMLADAGLPLRSPAL